MITHNDILFTSIRKEMEWAERYDWTGYTQEERFEVEKKKTVEIYKGLCQEYGLK